MTTTHAPPHRLLPAAAEGSARMTVLPSHLASAYGDGGREAYPDVLATPAVVGLIERACAAVLQPLLQDGEMSVGVHVELTHKAPTPPGAQVLAQARYLRQDGRLFVFAVEASDEAGTVAAGQHARAIVRRADVERKAAERSPA